MENAIYIYIFDRSEVLPSEKKCGYNINYPGNTIGANHSVNGKMFLLSIQIHETDVVRAYWSTNHGWTRFYVKDIINFMPFCFVKQKNENYKKIIMDYIKQTEKNMPLKETNFDTFLKQNTKIYNTE